MRAVTVPATEQPNRPSIKIQQRHCPNAAIVLFPTLVCLMAPQEESLMLKPAFASLPPDAVQALIDSYAQRRPVEHTLSIKLVAFPEHKGYRSDLCQDGNH